MNVKPGTVTGTVPGFFLWIPFQLTAEMGAFYGHGDQLTLLVPVDTTLFFVNLHDPAMAGRESVHRDPTRLQQSAAQTVDRMDRIICQMFGGCPWVKALRGEQGCFRHGRQILRQI